MTQRREVMLEVIGAELKKSFAECFEGLYRGEIKVFCDRDSALRANVFEIIASTEVMRNDFTEEVVLTRWEKMKDRWAPPFRPDAENCPVDSSGLLIEWSIEREHRDEIEQVPGKIGVRFFLGDKALLTWDWGAAVGGLEVLGATHSQG